MPSHAAFAEIAALAGDPARAAMLHALMDGRALTSGELAAAAGIAPQTASRHLAQLAAAGLFTMVKAGRHRYHRLASPAVARMVESIMRVAADTAATRRPVRVGPRDAALRAGRTCYDHLAGRLGVALADAMVARGHVELEADAGVLTAAGAAALRGLGLDLDAGPAKSGRLFCRPCLDWSERRPHLAGRLGAALCAHCLEAGWVRRVAGSRAVSLTPKGRLGLERAFGMRLDAPEQVAV